MQKIILIGIVTLGMSFSSCDLIEPNQSIMINEDRFSPTQIRYSINGVSYDEYVDRTTGNMYIGGGFHQGLCPLYDKDGKIANIDTYSK